METSFATSAAVWNSELGEFISEDHRRMAEVIRDAFPTYSLVYIPKNDRVTAEDRAKPWAILDSPANMQPYIVRYMTEADMTQPQQILAWLLAGDLVRNRPGDVLARIEAEENAKALLELKRKEDDLEERIDKVAFLTSGGRGKKHTLNLGDGRKMER